VTNGPDCASTTAWTINYYTYSSAGQEDGLVTPAIDLAGFTGAHLTFDHAYARYDEYYSDGFRVDISSDCGSSWTNLYQASGSTLATASDNTSSSWAPASCSEWAAHDIDLGAYDGQTIKLRFVGTCGYGQRLYFDNVAVTGTPAAVAVSVRMYLDGCYSTTDHLMTDQLRAQGLLPTTEPYTGLGYSLPGGGGETADAGVLAVTGDDAVVDWVIVELRDANAPGTIVAAQCALLQRDGDVVAADGSSNLQFATPPGNYYIAVRHRNHLGCMTATARALSGTALTVDFGLAATTTYGTDARRSVDGHWMLWAGDATHDGNIKYTGSGNDREPVLQAIGGTMPTSTVSGYQGTDVNLDGQVKYTGSGNDRDPILENLGGAVPTATRQEQLP
jgi:hypothetical protein